MASGVTSRKAGPVPPVVNTKQQPASTNSIKAALIFSCSSGISFGINSIGLVSAVSNQLFKAGKPRSWYTPELARSLIETIPILMASARGSVALIHRLQGHAEGQGHRQDGSHLATALERFEKYLGRLGHDAQRHRVSRVWHLYAPA